MRPMLPVSVQVHLVVGGLREGFSKNWHLAAGVGDDDGYMKRKLQVFLWVIAL